MNIVSIHAGMNWERNPVDAIQENQIRWMSKTSIGSPTGPSGSTDRKAGRLLKRLPDRCSDAVVGAADESSVFFWADLIVLNDRFHTWPLFVQLSSSDMIL